jgi:hypothetical protein
MTSGVDTPQVITFAPAGPTLARFMRSNAFYRGIMGPIGSAKSTTCAVEILRRAQAQTPNPRDGIRYSRWAIIRNTYPELKMTTLKTWGAWCPLQYGKLNMDSPIVHHIKTTELDIEVFFLALDREDDVKKLLSLELTGAWVNEAREIPKGIMDALTGRVGRFPSKRDGGCTWFGIIADTNPPDDQSWWYRMDREERPKGWEFFQQPSGRSLDAENIENLPDNYYENIQAGKDEDWIKVYVDGEYGYVVEGKPVFPEYRDRLHCATELLLPWRDIALEIGADFGLTPAAVIGQKDVSGRWQVIDEFVTDNCGVQRFAESLAKFVNATYPDHTVAMGWGDPAGNKRSEIDEKKALEIMAEYTGWKWKAAPTNEPMMRQEAVKGALNRLVDGRPGIILSPKCKFLRKGFTGGYHFKKVQVANGSQYHDTPAKNAYSHPHDGLQYLLLGGGEHDVILNRVKRRQSQGNRSRARMAQDVDYDLFSRR